MRTLSRHTVAQMPSGIKPTGFVALQLTHSRRHAAHVGLPCMESSPPRQLVQAPHSISSDSRGIRSVAELTNAWALVSGKLPVESDSRRTADVELIIKALKLAISSLQSMGPTADGRTPSERAAALAGRLAELCSAGVPLDAASIAAGVVADAVDLGVLSPRRVAQRLGGGVAALVHDVLRVRSAPHRVDVYDEATSRSIREYCLAFTDVRACVVEVICRLDALRHCAPLVAHERQAMALEALQIYAPLGHALGLGPVCAALEDACFKVLFPSSYGATSRWLRDLLQPAEAALLRCQRLILSRLEQDPRFKDLADSCVMRARTKSEFSLMKKLLRLDNLAAGGRRRDEVHDVLGMRALVKPRQDLPPQEAEEAAVRACYIVREVALSMFEEVPERHKDYIAQPKANGYQSIHMSLRLPLENWHPGSSSSGGSSSSSSRSGGSSTSSTGSTSSSSSSTFAKAASSSSYSSSSDDTSSVSDASTRASSMNMHAGSSRPRDSSRVTHASASGTYSGSPAPRDKHSLGPPGLHPSATVEGPSATGVGPWSHPLVPCVELQVRTARQDQLAESGAAAHTAYKGGLDLRQVAQLQAWTQQFQQQRAAPQLAAPRPPIAHLQAPSPEDSTQQAVEDAGDGGGELTPTGDAGLSAAMVAVGAATAAVTGLFDSIDRDGSGTLSISELQQLLEELSVPEDVVDTTTAWQQQQQQQQQQRTSLGDIDVYGGAMGRQVLLSSGSCGLEVKSSSSGSDAQELLALLDTDDDGVVTLEEFSNFQMRLRQLE